MLPEMPLQSVDLEKALQEDGFINFYSILGASPSTEPEEMQENINALYQDAQINRDHRVPARRRDYQILLEVLPQARVILLDPKRRKRYDAYCNAVEMDAPRLPYAEFMADLMRDKDLDDGRSDILTLRDLSRLHLAAEPREATETSQDRPMSDASLDRAAEIAAKEAAAKEAAPQAPIAAQWEAPSPEAPAETAKELPPAPVWKAQTFSAPACIGGAFVLMGLVSLLPSFTGLPLSAAGPVSLVCAVVTAYVFSMANDPIEV